MDSNEGVGESPPKKKIIRPTTVFSDTYSMRSPHKIAKQMYKGDLKQTGFPFIDHIKTFAYKDKGQRGPARKEQTFLVSFAYKGTKTWSDVEEYLAGLKYGLRGDFEPCTFRGLDAWQIVIADTDVVLEDAMKYARENISKAAPVPQK